MQHKRFFKWLYGGVPDGVVELTYIAPKELDLRPHIATQWLPMPLTTENLNKIPSVVNQWNGQGYGAYVGMTVRESEKDTGRGRKEDARWLTHLWCDVDDIDEGDGITILQQFDPQPSFIVGSGGGVHGYWILGKPIQITDANRDDIEQTLQGIAVAVGAKADRSVRDLARVLRIPGTTNTKPKRDGVTCDILHVNWHNSIIWNYRYATLERLYKPMGAPPQPQITRYVPESAYTQDSDLPKPVQQYLNTSSPVGERNRSLFVAARWCNDVGISQMEAERRLASRAAADGLPGDEINRTIASAYRYQPDVSKRLPGRFSVRMAAADTRIKRGGAA